MESPVDGSDSDNVSPNPSPIFIKAKINKIQMNIMFDSGSTKSFIHKAALSRTHHPPIKSNKQQYVLADGHTTMDVLGTVQLVIDLPFTTTSIIADVTDSLCVDCILGMDYINKYKVNLDNKQKSVQIYTNDSSITLPMITSVTPSRTICRLEKDITFHPFQEQMVKTLTSFKTGEYLFSPAFHMGHVKGFIIPHSLVSVKNHTTHFSLYNSTNQETYLRANTIIGTLTPISNNYDHISTIYDPNIIQKFDENQSRTLTHATEQFIDSLINHVAEYDNRSELKTMLIKHHSLFDTSRTTIAETPIPHVICTGDNPPTTSRPYPQSIDKQNATFEILQEMLKNKQIRESNSQYSAPILLIKKRDGSFRFIVDYRKLNQITKQDNYPLPNLEQAIQMVGGHRYYSKLDLRSGYFQIPIREADKHKTAFITVHGLYEFNVLAQGLKNSPPTFQRIMANLLLPCKKFALVYLDDILIYSSSFQQHLEHLNQVLAILNRHKFQLSPHKCELVKTSIDYLGHTINAQGIKPLQDRIEKILAIPQPTSLNAANAFIGAIGWYRKFIKDFTKIAAPILSVTNLTKQNRHKFTWGESQQQAFERLKQAIVKEPLFLNYPHNDETLILTTDASDYCIGGVLYQEINGERKNIYFHSQMLPKAQQKWSTIEKEALAIYYCVTRMKLFLLGREFIIQTDHCPLQNMHNKPSQNRRVDRISLILQQYTIKEIRHISGKCNCLADYLSRYPRQTEDENDTVDPDFGFMPQWKSPVNNNIINAVTTRAQARANQQSTAIDTNEETMQTTVVNDSPLQGANHEFDVTRLIDAQKHDQLYQEKVVELGKDSTCCSYILEDGVLYKNINDGPIQRKLLYVPTSMIKHLVKAYHDSHWAGHFGCQRTYSKLRHRYWWPNMRTSIKNYISTCLLCQRFNVERRKSAGFLHPIEPPRGPFQLIGIDYSGPFPVTPNGNKYVLAVTDYFTKWVLAIPVPTQTAQATAEVLYEHYICIYGVPDTIISDQGSHFNNELMRAFTVILGCHHIKSTPYHPQTNGAIERFNSTFERQVAKLTNQYSNTWDLHLKSITFAYNTGRHAATEFSPYQLQFGRYPKLPPDPAAKHYDFSKPNDYFKFLQQTLSIYHKQTRENIKAHQTYYTTRYNKNRRDPHYQIGDYVLKRLNTFPSKLSALYSDPMIIIQARHPTYLIQDPNNQKIFQVHVSQLRSFTMQ